MKHLSTLLKFGATVALFWFVLSKVDIADLAARLTVTQIAVALAAGLGAVSVQALVAAIRLMLCVRLLGGEVTTRGAWVACQYGGFFSHTPISFVGGDAMRIWHLVKLDVPLADSAKAVVVDRALGFMAMMSFVIVTSPLLYSAIRDVTMLTGYVILVTIGAAAIVAFLLLGGVRPIPTRSRILRWIAEFATVSRYLAVRPRLAAEAFLLALTVSVLNVIAIWGIALGYSGEVGFITALAATPVVFLIAMVPISVAGWGLREGAFVVAFGLFGVPASAALSISVTFGIAVLLAYSPAAVLLVMARRQTSAPGKDEEYAPASAPPPGRS